MSSAAAAAAPSFYLFKNGAVASPPHSTPPVTTFLETHPGAYTSTRTSNAAASLLFWDRHVRRLSQSLRILFTSNPQLLFGPSVPNDLKLSAPVDLDEIVRSRLRDSAREAAAGVVRGGDEEKEELMVTALIGGDGERLRECGVGDDVVRVLDVYLHIGMFVPGVEQMGARLAVVGSKRDLAQAKYSDWVRLRKPLEKMKPVSATEVLLSEDGDKILEGCRTNFFVVCLKEPCDSEGGNSYAGCFWKSYEVQTAPLQDGVLPGVIRELVIEICVSKGIAVREVSPSWSASETWKEAFITNSVRLVQHVAAIQAPISWPCLQSKALEEVSWEEKHFKPNPGMVTAMIQREITDVAGREGYPFVPV